MGPGTRAAAASTRARNSLPGRVYTTHQARRATRVEACGSRRKQDFPPPSPQPRVPGKLKIDRNVQIRPARPSRRSLRAGHCPPLYTLWGAGGPGSLSPKKISLGFRISTERAPKGQGRPQGVFAERDLCPAPMEVLFSHLENVRTSDFQHLGPIPLSPIPDTPTRASVP